MQELHEITRYPTPIAPGKPAGFELLWIKNDGLSGTPYGGNKIRKLERILPLAVQRGARRILTAGAAGSHHVLATTVLARAIGLPTTALLWPQHASEHAANTLAASLAQGLDAVPVRSIVHAVAGLRLRRRPTDFVIPIGGAGLAGTLAYAHAVHELRRDIEAGRLPEPDRLVVPVGTGTTAGGLLAGLVLAGMKTELVGVLVAHNPVARWVVLAAASRALVALGAPGAVFRAADRLVIDRSRVGRGYGHPTAEGAAATAAALSLDLVLDPTYTAKAFGRALAEAGAPKFSIESGSRCKEGPRRTLYWHTLSAEPLAPLQHETGRPGRDAFPTSLFT